MAALVLASEASCRRYGAVVKLLSYVMPSKFNSFDGQIHGKPFQSNGSERALKNLPFDQKYSYLNVICFYFFHCSIYGEKLLFLQLYQCLFYCSRIEVISTYFSCPLKCRLLNAKFDKKACIVYLQNNPVYINQRSRLEIAG